MRPGLDDSSASRKKRDREESSQSVVEYRPTAVVLRSSGMAHSIRPKWRAPWKMLRVMSGHQGWVRCIAVDPTNEWIATGSADRTIKIWDIASGALKLTLPGHISTVRGLAISPNRPYMFSGEDKMAKCWDLEVNRVVRQYHGHLSGIYSCALHPTLDLFITGSRDSSVRVWDVRTKTCVQIMIGHANTVACVATQSSDPQVISGSYDATVRTWDIIRGCTAVTLTHHKKAVRSLVIHPSEYTFASASTDNIKKWKCPEAAFLHNFSGHRAIVNTLALNSDGVLFSGADNGSMRFWDWKTGFCFQDARTIAQPGSLESEAGIFGSAFDMSGTRLFTVEADKTVKVWKEDETATEETHPLQWTTGGRIEE